MTALDTLRALYAAIERGENGTDLHAYWADEVSTREHPNLISPTGATHDLADMTAGSTRGAGLLARQSYDVVEAHDLGDTAIVRLTWRGVIARTVGPFTEGQELVAHIAQFVRARDGRLTEIVTYDCYEPFS